MANTNLAELEEINDGMEEETQELVLVENDSSKSAESDDDDTAAEENERYSAGKVSRKDVDATRLYLKEIEFSPLLTADEEKHYSRLAQKGDESALRNIFYFLGVNFSLISAANFYKVATESKNTSLSFEILPNPALTYNF